MNINGFTRVNNTGALPLQYKKSIVLKEARDEHDEKFIGNLFMN